MCGIQFFIQLKHTKTLRIDGYIRLNTIDIPINDDC